MPNFTPTQEQLDILEAATTTKDNILISALAGAAKTSTLELIAKELTRETAICLAFNKAIATEMQQRLPSNFKAMTLNSLGHRVWGEYLGQRLKLSFNKMSDILKELMEELTDRERDEVWDSMADIRQTLRFARSAGHLPDEFYAEYSSKCQRLLTDADLEEECDYEFSDTIWKLIHDALLASARQAMRGVIDFDDQILMPSLFKCIYPLNNLVLVDEVQDLSALNHLMLQQLVRRRIIAVGDQCQAIYAFRGAFEDGMAQLRDRFDMTEMTLSTSFRCPEAIVKHVQWRAPHMKHWADNPAPGSVTILPYWELSDIPDRAAVICRNNAPLLSLGMKLLKSGRYPKIWGNDIAAGLVKTLKKLGPNNMQQAQVLEAINDWHDGRAKKVRNLAALQDRTECLRVIARAAPTLGGALQYAETIFSAEGKIELMTAHKSKGHEFPIVFILNRDLMGDKGQELNLRYVAATRAKEHLIYMDMDNLDDEFNPVSA